MNDLQATKTRSKYFKFVNPPEDVDVIERINDFVWQQPNGIWVVVAKEEQRKLTKNEFLADLEFWKRKAKGSRIRSISIANPKMSSTKEQRELSEEEIPKIFEAVAIVTDSALGRIVIKIFTNLKPPKGYSLGVFDSYAAAEKWVLHSRKQ